MLVLILILLSACPLVSADLFNGRNLEGWRTVGDGLWTVTRDRTLVGQRDTTKPPANTDPNQAWLYTEREFGEYDLHLEWWTRWGGNSGVSIRDQSRARYSFGKEADPKRTPSHIGYEIQISNGYKDRYPSGSIYLFQAALAGPQVPNDWNAFDIEVRDPLIRVKLNGKLVAEHPGDPKRSKRGPIGLQLHDSNSLVMFRNIRIVER
jgi:cytochrome c